MPVKHGVVVKHHTEWLLSNRASLQETVSGRMVTDWEMKLSEGAGMEQEISQVSIR